MTECAILDRMPFVAVQVEEHEALPEGCSLRFKAQDAGEPIATVTWESEDGVCGTWTVAAEASNGAHSSATAYRVDDSSAGTSLLIVGGGHGLRLTLDATQIAEPYLLLPVPSKVD